jgi:hypothetical protein
MKLPVKKPEHPKKLEKAAEEIRALVKDGQRKLLEFEVMMSINEIKEGKSEAYGSAADLIKDLD